MSFAVQLSKKSSNVSRRKKRIWSVTVSSAVIAPLLIVLLTVTETAIVVAEEAVHIAQAAAPKLTLTKPIGAKPSPTGRRTIAKVPQPTVFFLHRDVASEIVSASVIEITVTGIMIGIANVTTIVLLDRGESRSH